MTFDELKQTEQYKRYAVAADAAHKKYINYSELINLAKRFSIQCPEQWLAKTDRLMRQRKGFTVKLNALKEKITHSPV